MDRMERTVAVICGLLTVVSLALVGVQAVRNPMEERQALLEIDLDSVRYVEEEFSATQNVELGGIGQRITSKKALWTELVRAAPKPPKKQARPNLAEKLKGVVPSARMEIVSADGVQIKIVLPKNKEGAWMGVGDKINGLTITEIREDVIVFSLKQRGEEYFHSLPRR